MIYVLFLLLSTQVISCLHIKQTPSPNFNNRKDLKTHTIITKPTHIILHYTADCFYSQSMKTLSNFFRPVSAHYLIAADGTISQLVDESKRAWHAGKSSWQGNKQMNNYSIGIEIVNPGFTKSKKDPCTHNQNIWNKHTGVQVQGSSYYWYQFTDAQITSVIALCTDIMKRYDIKPYFILGHSDIAPSRKVDPGPLFPWELLAKYDIGAWSNKIFSQNMNNHELRINQTTIKKVQCLLQAWGYHVTTSGKMNKKTKHALQAFQMHFRPSKIDGTIDSETIFILNNLIKKYLTYENNTSYNC
ncbi:MAG: hypothetical protein CL947_02050 [Epsilonproteobacteria bacterium]|nr:hypothetical protein [Campylobacterota bacterium]|tara:strand:- start:516 stop:1418 length:903 start_codon:yes stop_codon:yes gene_type:complete